MEWLVWIGAAMTLLGLGGLGWCVAIAIKAKRQGLEGEAMEVRLRGIVALNMAALAVSAIGLMMVVIGVFLA